jgi:hypothetical protein
VAYPNSGKIYFAIKKQKEGKMKNNELKFIVLIFISYYIIGLPSQILAQTIDGDQLRLEGFELAKGVDLTDTYRVGTIFAGEVFNADDGKVGRWTVILSHRGTENIEVCGESGDIVTIRLTINFNSGQQLVLGMVDLGGAPDVFWDFAYNGPSCSLGGLDCVPCGITVPKDCTGETSNLAMVQDILLKPKSGSTIKIKSAILYDGRLCHYYPVIPRVSARLKINK